MCRLIPSGLSNFHRSDVSPIVKPFMPAGYARHLFFFFFSFGVDRPRSPPPPPAFPSRVAPIVIVFGYSSFPHESPSRFLCQGTFDTRPCFSLAALLRCNCTFFHPLRISCDSRVFLHFLLHRASLCRFLLLFLLLLLLRLPSFSSSIRLFFPPSVSFLLPRGRASICSATYYPRGFGATPATILFPIGSSPC